MTKNEIYAALTNGDEKLGKTLTRLLALSLVVARKKHPKHAQTQSDAAHAIFGEYYELYQAIEEETDYRQFCEALDVATTALRFLLREFKTVDIGVHGLAETRIAELEAFIAAG